MKSINKSFNDTAFYSWSYQTGSRTAITSYIPGLLNISSCQCCCCYALVRLKSPELKTLEWNILNPDRLINLEINKRGEQALRNLEIKKKWKNLDIHYSIVFSSGLIGIADRPNSCWSNLRFDLIRFDSIRFDFNWF